MPARAHLADRRLRWSPLNSPPDIVDAAGGLVRSRSARRKVVIYGAGGGHLEAPLDDPDWEVWAINLIPPYDRDGRVRADRWFDLHQRVAQTPDDLRWIESCPLPIYVPEDLLDAGPHCVRFPHERLEARFGVAYWTCSFCYQIALALHEGFTHIGLFGVELSIGTRRERSVEWAGVSWWMGYAEALGVAFHLPAMTRLGTHQFRYGIEYAEEIADVEAYLASVEDMEMDEQARTRAAREAGARAPVVSVGG